MRVAIRLHAELSIRGGGMDGEGRSSGRVVESKGVILVEGILILSVRELAGLMDLKVYVVRVLLLIA